MTNDEINEGGFEFLDKTVKIINTRIEEAEKYYQEILDKPFDFEKDEQVELDAKKVEYSKDKTALKESWRKALKYQVLTKVVQQIEKQESNDTIKDKKPFAEIEKEQRAKVLKNNKDWFKRLKRLNDKDRLDTYLKCITLAFDPHSTFYPPKEKEDFDISISGKLEGIGATLQEKDGFIKVVKIVPGSASWKQGELKDGDIILKVGQGEEEPVSIEDMRLDEAVKLIRGPKGTEVRLTVKKKIDASIKVIPIIRDVVLLEESYAKSAVVEDKSTDKKVGYIKLPKFYADFSGTGGRNCSDDIAKEIKKLKKDNIDGIVLDLRDNGGGSLRDVIKMVGLFIETGPVVQVKSRSGDAYPYGDNDRRVQYDGPLVVMVNSFSASASEILAAAIQDYNRGIIIGTPTFGKGTVQRVLNLDSYLSLSDLKEFGSLGSIKLTTQKFYRINGGTTQLEGVTPDIILPNFYSYMDLGEREMDYALKWDQVSRANYDEENSINKKRKKLAKKSTKRFKKDNTFRLVDENAKRLKSIRDNTTSSLNLKKFREEKEAEKNSGEKYKDIFKVIESLNVTTPTADKELIESDETKVETNKAFQKELTKDPYLLESIRVVKDIKYKPKK